MSAQHDVQGFWIDGEIRKASGPDRHDLIEPGTGKVYASTPTATQADVDAAVRAARHAFDAGDWSKRSQAERIAVVSAALDIVSDATNDIAEDLIAEIGAPVRIGRMAVQGAIAVARGLCAEVADLPAVERRDGPWEYLLQHCPVGVVANISPWNGPFFTTLVKSTTALVAGCTVVDKPPAEAPFDGLHWARALAEAGLPAGAFNLIPAGPAVSAYLVAHPGVDKVSFTGGTSNGRKVAAVCGEQLKSVVLELGGKSAAIVLDDADLAVVANGIVAGTFFNAGQVCSALTRVIVPASREDEVAELLCAAASRVTVGDPRDESTMMGPLFSAAHRARVHGFVQRGVESGAGEVLIGGQLPDDSEPGWFYPATVLRGVDNSAEIAQEELFGPVAVIIPYPDGDEERAISYANDSAYGLHGAVFSRDLDRAVEVASRLQTGSVTINGYTSNFAAPREGWKGSGIGVQNGAEGFATHRLNRVVNLRPSANTWNPGAVMKD